MSFLPSPRAHLNQAIFSSRENDNAGVRKQQPNRNTYHGELGKRLAMKLADGFVDRLMGEDNDLVVDTESMFVVDPVPSAQLVEKLPFGKNGEIYHTVNTHWSVGDLSALDFSKTFYEQLLEGKNMMIAVAAARQAAKNKEEMTWLSYVVYADPYARLVRE